MVGLLVWIGLLVFCAVLKLLQLFVLKATEADDDGATRSQPVAAPMEKGLLARKILVGLLMSAAGVGFLCPQAHLMVSTLHCQGSLARATASLGSALVAVGH